ncbi:MAG: response regulator [Planctomycetes bacterium]|nr:response regulator [Planctomycetota bacterium]
MNTMPINEPKTAGAVLVVEDNFLVGVLIARNVERLGYRAIGPVASASDAIARLASQSITAAILDINIRGGTSEPVAEALERAGIPFFFVTGYASPLLISQRLQSTLRLSKPVSDAELKRALETSVGPRSA